MAVRTSLLSMLFWSANAGVFNGEKNGWVGEFEPSIPENTNTLVVGDAMNPRFDRAFSAERRQSGLHRYECRLDNIFSPWTSGVGLGPCGQVEPELGGSGVELCEISPEAV